MVWGMEYLEYEPYHVVIEVANEKCRVLEILRSVGVERFRLIDIRSFEGGITKHLVRLSREDAEKLPKFSISRAGKLGEDAVVWVESEGCGVCHAILSHGAFLVSGLSTGDSNIVYSFIAPSFTAVKGIISALEASNLKPKILRVVRYRPRGGGLTEKQEKILWLALKMGFFDYPRKINTIELSRKLGIKSSTLSEIIRRGIRRLLERYFES
jgi:predicted DNA binding protein